MRQKFRKVFQAPLNTQKNQQKWLATLLAILLQRLTRYTAATGRATDDGSNYLFTCAGSRKYLTSAERHRFEAAVQAMPHEVRLFCLVLLWSGCRISEALAITPTAIDREANIIAFITLKRRSRRVIRQIPMPPAIVDGLAEVFELAARERDLDRRSARLWKWHRTTAWRYVKIAMRVAGVSGSAAMPKGLRHGFGVAAFQAVPPHLVQRWLGHASLRTTAIYGEVSGMEEQLFAQRLWDNW